MLAGTHAFTGLDLEWVVHELRSVKDGHARLVMTPDGILTILFGHR